MPISLTVYFSYYNFFKYKNLKFSSTIITLLSHTVKNIKANISGIINDSINISIDLHSLCLNLSLEKIWSTLNFYKRCTVKKSKKPLNANIFLRFHFKNTVNKKSRIPFLPLYTLSESSNKICLKKWFRDLLG
jgi:hypothetical protein